MILFSFVMLLIWWWFLSVDNMEELTVWNVYSYPTCCRGNVMRAQRYHLWIILIVPLDDFRWYWKCLTYMICFTLGKVLDCWRTHGLDKQAFRSLVSRVQLISTGLFILNFLGRKDPHSTLLWCVNNCGLKATCWQHLHSSSERFYHFACFNSRRECGTRYTLP